MYNVIGFISVIIQVYNKIKNALKIQNVQKLYNIGTL